MRRKSKKGTTPETLHFVSFSEKGICKKIPGQLSICIDFLILLCIILVVLYEMVVLYGMVVFYDAISLLSIA